MTKAAFLLLLTLMSTEANGLCLTDQELKFVMESVYIYSIGQTLGACARKHPSLRNQAMEVRNLFQATYEKQLQTTAKESSKVFERLYPGRGVEVRNENDELANKEGLKVIEALSQEQCRTSIHGLKVLIGKNDWAEIMNTKYVTARYQSERSRFPRCP